jgi:hypothetical protein
VRAEALQVSDAPKSDAAQPVTETEAGKPAGGGAGRILAQLARAAGRS